MVGKLLGEGGMARVYRAVDTVHRSGRGLQGLKAPLPGMTRPSGRVFEREAQSMARIRHDHVVRIFGLTDSQDPRAIIMELMPGGSLRDRITASKTGKLGLESVRPWPGRPAAAGLGAAHRMNIVHRDVKPSNLLFDHEGRIKVADFGAIRVLEEATWVTTVGQQIGTPAYMSPEQCAGQPVMPAATFTRWG